MQKEQVFAFFHLIPAHAGVILRNLGGNGSLVTYPRARGGDPEYTDVQVGQLTLSPRTRG